MGIKIDISQINSFVTSHLSTLLHWSTFLFVSMLKIKLNWYDMRKSIVKKQL